MDKRRLHHLWTKVRWIKPWYFLVLAVISTVICVLALRANNQHMIKLRDAVYAADKNNTDVQKPLQNLQAYVTSHMNTDLNTGKTTVYPPIQLEYTYNRLVQAEADQLADSNSGLYSQAQAYCEAQDHTDFSGHNRVPCIEQYVESHTTQPLAPIQASLYKFAFVTPPWSPDLAGWSMLAAIITWTLFVVTFLARRLIRHASR